MVEVIQGDRDAAAGIAKETHWFTARDRIGMVQGRNDSHPIVQAFARHRLESTRAQADFGEVGELVERLRARERFHSINGEIITGGCIADIEAVDEAAGTILALQAEVERLEAENFTLAAGQCVVEHGLIGDEHGHFGCALQAEVERLSGALEPFARHGDHYLGTPDDYVPACSVAGTYGEHKITLANFRRARAALSKDGGGRG